MNILETILLPSVRRIYTEEDMPTFWLGQDNSAIHTVHIVKKWFIQHPEIEVLDWSFKSPNLNLIKINSQLNLNLIEMFKSNCEFMRKLEKNLIAHVSNIQESCSKSVGTFK